MAVEDTLTPKAKKVGDVTSKGKEEGEGYWEKQVRETRAKKELKEAERELRNVENPPEQPEPAFQVRGHIDIDPAREAKESREREEKAREKADAAEKERDDKIQILAAERDEKTRELADTKMGAAMEKMTTQFNAALEVVNKTLEEVKKGADPSALVGQFQALRKASEEMSSLRGGPQVDPSIQLEITKLEMENARAEREFKAKMEQDRREWDLKFEALHDDKAFKRATLAQAAQSEERKSEFWNNLPKTLGGAMGAGILAKQGKGGRVAQEPTEEAPPSESKTPKGHHFELAWGGSGEGECPGCSQPVAIGPTARTAICANCGERVPVRRIGEKP